MVTLAVAYAFNVLASQLSWLTGGEDGRSFQVPSVLRPGFKLVDSEIFGFAITGRTASYYLVFAGCVALFLVLLRVVNSPFGRVLQAIRENPFRAEALGYRIVFHRTLATCIAAAGATAAGALNALWLRYVGPDTALPAFPSRSTCWSSSSSAAWASLYGADRRRGAVRRRGELSAGADGRAFGGRGRRSACRCCRACSIPTAGCCGSA